MDGREEKMKISVDSCGGCGRQQQQRKEKGRKVNKEEEKREKKRRNCNSNEFGMVSNICITVPLFFFFDGV